jgi:predicted phosphoribosyltransferase
MRFADREDAGRALAEQLAEYDARGDVLVRRLPRGGVPVAAQVASALHTPLDVLLVRKLGAPGHEELAMGAIASGGIVDLDENIVKHLGVTPAQVELVLRREAAELERRERVYRNGRAMPSVRGKTVIVVDDGLATGATMRAAVSALRQLDPARIVAATPVASNEACDDLRRLADECVCVSTPDPFYAVGAWYRDFTPPTDEEVTAQLDRSGEGAEHGERSTSGGAAP